MLTNWRSSKIFRITAILILLNFFLSQTTFAQEELNLQEGTHLYTPVKEVDAQLASSEESITSSSIGLESVPESLANNFWNESPLSPPTQEMETSASYTSLIMAEDTLNEVSSPVTAPTTLDTTPPTTPIVTDAGTYATSGKGVRASWTSGDPESVIVEYQYLLRQDSLTGPIVVNWTSTGTGTSATLSLRVALLVLKQGKTYFFQVKARNEAGLWSEIGSSDGIMLEKTTAVMGQITDDGIATSSTSELHATWTPATDPESGIAKYEYLIRQDSTSGPIIVGYTSVGLATEVTKIGLNLISGKTYYIGVRAHNGAGLYSPPTYSNGIIVDTVAPTATSMVINNNAAYANSLTLTMNVTASDATSGVGEARFSTDGVFDTEAWQTFSPTMSFTIPQGEGTRQVWGQVRDRAGLVSNVVTDTVIVDTIKPATQLNSSRYSFDRNYELRYDVEDIHLEGSYDGVELVELARGKNEFTRTFKDLAGNVTNAKWTIYLDENAERGTFFDYDANGNITSRIDPNANKTEYEYDSNNRVTKITYADGSTVHYTYDGAGKRTSMQDSTGITYYIYDIANRLIAVQHNSDVIQYSYDNASNLTEMIYGGVTVKYAYDAANRLSEVREQRAGQADKVTTYTYNDAGDLIQAILPNGIKTDYSYDSAGRLVSIGHSKETSPSVSITLDTVDYTLDASGNRTSMRIFNSNATRQDRVLNYSYDLFGRLVQEKDSDFSYTGNILRTTTNYTYDAAGNRLTKEFIPATIDASNPRILTRYTYGGDNRVLSLVEEKYDAAGNIFATWQESFTYDAAGNLIQKITPEKTIHYDYDSEGRLVLWTDEKDFVEFFYDGDGNRIEKRVNGEFTYYVVDPNREISQVLAELDPTGAVKQTYAYGLDRVSAYSVQGTASSYFLQDGLGSTIGLSNSTGSVTDTYSYDAFGNPLIPNSSSLTPFLYAGEQLDPETGLIYLRARYYDPSLGRFISRDPVLGSLDETQSFNPYPYVQNNPVNFKDPLGLAHDENERRWIYIPGQPPGFGQQLPSGGFTRDYPPSLQQDVLISTTASEYLKATWGVLRGAGGIAGYAASSLYRVATGESPLQALMRKIDENKKYFGGPPGGGGGGGSYFSRPSDSSYNNFSRSLLGSSRAGSRGGVLLDKALSITGLSINDITGVTFDPYTGQVVLLGEAGGTVPEIEMDYLITALKALFGTIEDPGVTIDPVLVNGQPDWTQPQNVIHFGDIEDTNLGWTVFEADRLMKSINMGEDNITGTEMTQDGYNVSESYIASQIPGFKNMLTRWSENLVNAGERHSRFWFVPKEMKLVRSNGQDTFVFDQNSVELLTEDLLIGGGATDPDAEAYSQFFTAHYQEFANLYPVYKELEKAARAVAFAKFIRDHNIPIDLSWLSSAPLPIVPTPRTTPVGENSSGSITVRGGVTVDFINGQNFTYLADTFGEAAGIRSDSLGVRPDDLATQWNFSSSGTSYDASALSLAPTRKDANFYWQEPDLSFDTTGDFDLEWSRYYDSFKSRFVSSLSAGWSFLPYTVESPEASRSYVISGQTRWLFPKIRFSDRAGQQTEDMILTYLLGDGTLVYSPEGLATGSSLMLHADNSFTFTYDDRRKVHFSATGPLQYLEDQNGNRVSYAYDAFGRLMSITDAPSGRQISLSYDGLNRIVRVDAPEGKTLTYIYDSVTGDLESSTESWTNRTTTYQYDLEHRLTKAINHAGKTLFTNTYDELGRLTSQIDEDGNLKNIAPNLLTHQTLTTDPLNSAQSKLAYDSLLRLSSARDALGNQTSYTYGGSYGPTSILDPRGNITAFAYGSYGNQKSSTDPLNHASRFDYASFFGDSRLVFNEEGTGFGQYLEYFSTGNLKNLMEGVLPIRDANGNLTGYYATPLVTQFAYDVNGNLTGITDANLKTTNFLYDSTGNLTKITNALGKSTDLTYETVSVEAARHEVSVQGDAQIDTAESKFGGASAVFDGLDDFLSVPDSSDFDFGTGDFTIEAWVNFSDPNWFNGVISKYMGGTGWIFTINTSSGDMTLYDSGSTTVSVNSSFTANTWYHVAVVRSGNVIKFFKDGIQQGTNQAISATRTFNGAATPLKVGIYDVASGAFKGHIDEVRVSKGIARYVSTSFPLPTAEYAGGDSNTKLLLHMNGADGSTDIRDTSLSSTSLTNRVSQIKDPLNRFINFTYNPVNEKVTSVQTQAGNTQYGYDVRDRLTSITDPLGRITQFQYRDQIDKIIETRELGDVANLLDDLVAVFDYDRFGNLTSLAGPLGGATSFTYDLLNRLTRIIAPETTPLPNAEQVEAINLTSSSAQVRFTASEMVSRAILRVNEKERAAYKTVTLEGPLSGEITFDVTGLSAGTEYEYEIELIDPETYHSVSRKHSFKTQGAPPAPSTAVQAQDLYGNVYDVSATTASLGVRHPDVDYSLIDYYRVTVTPAAGGTPIVKTVEPIFQGTDGLYYFTVITDVTGLQANTQYNYTVEIVPYSGVPFDLPPPVQGTFKTANPADMTPPLIQQNIVTPDVDRATVDFQTSEPLLWVIVAVVDYQTGERRDYNYFNPGTSGELLILDLKPETTYICRLFTKDLSGNESASDIPIFTTQGFDGTSPLVLKSRVIERTPTTAKVDVLSDEVLNSIQLEYREKNTSAWLSTSLVPTNRNVQFSLTGLTSGAAYEYRLKAADGSANKVSTPVRDLVLYSEPPTPVIENSNGIFELPIDSTILTQAAVSGVQGWAAELSKKFLRTFQDQYDFLVFIPSLGGGKRLSLETQGSTSDNDTGSFYWGGYNDVQGIGQQIFDARSSFGSSAAGEFEGMVVLDSGLSSGPDFRFSSSDFSEDQNRILWENVATQELAHRFGSYLTSSFGNPFGILGRADAHWNVFFDADFSPMDGNDWIDNGDGTFTLNKSYLDEAAIKRSSLGMPYNDLDLYTMGLLDSNQVGTSFVIENPTLEDGTRIRAYSGLYIEIENPDGTWSRPYYLPSDFVIRGTRRNITLSDIAALEGLRSPAFPNTQKDFKVAFINVTNEEDASIDSLEMSEKLNRFKDSFFDFFNDMARGLGNLLTPAAAPLAIGAMSTLEMVEMGTVPISTPSPLFSHFSATNLADPSFGGDSGRFEPIDRLGLIQRNFEAGLFARHSERSEESRLSFPSATRKADPSSGRNVFGLSFPKALIGNPVLSLSPVMLPASLLSNLAAEVTSLEKPILYSDWKREQGIKTTDPFAVDPVLPASPAGGQNPPPLLVNSETRGSVPTVIPNEINVVSSPNAAEQHCGEAACVLIGDLDSRFRGNDSLPSPQDVTSAPSPIPPPSPSRPSADSPTPRSALRTPHSSHTPLIWNALEPRSAQKGTRKKEIGRSDILSFIKWKHVNDRNEKQEDRELKARQRFLQPRSFLSPPLLLSISVPGILGVSVNSVLNTLTLEFQYISSHSERTPHFQPETLQKS